MISRNEKRNVDFQIISEWIEPGSRVLDLGCGRGIFLEYLKKKKQVFGLGVDIKFQKIQSCIRRGLTAFQGDAMRIMEVFPDDFFDHVILSRTIEELEHPQTTLEEGLRVGKRLIVGFINFGYWKNRLHFLARGRQIENEVYPKKWYERPPTNAFSLSEFEHFCRVRQITIAHRKPLCADWTSLCRWWPNLRAGYVLCEISRTGSPEEPPAA